MKKKQNRGPCAPTHKSDSHNPLSPERQQMVEEVEGLLESVLIQEAGQAVWERFENALHQFDEESLSLLDDYLDGVTIEDLSKKKNLSSEQVSAWIDKLKRELSQQLRNQINLRQ